MELTRRVLSAAAVAACLVAIAAPSAAAASDPGWSVVPTVAPAGAVFSELYGVACSGAGTCTAVGGDFGSGSQFAALAERWDRTAFSIQPLPSPPPDAVSSVLFGVSCPAATACTAVGEYRIPTGDAEFRLVPLAEHWDGTAWSLQPVSGSGAMTGVSCPTVSDCTAVVGGRAERWNGSAWSDEPVPTPPGALIVGLDAVSCTAVNACIAVGNSTFRTGPGRFEQRPAAERWNGSAWSALPVPSPADSGQLSGVSCSAATACTAVGGKPISRSGSSAFTLAERWDGTAWSIQPTPTPPGAAQASLTGVSCPAATACTAVGSYSNGSRDFTLAEHWDRAAWSIQPTPNPGSGGNVLDAVACAVPASCLAVGTRDQGSPLAERFSG